MSEILPVANGISESELIKAAENREAFDRKEQVIPFLRVLQPLSPQVQDIPDAKPGMICNTAIGTLQTEALVVPIIHQWDYTEWLPDRGGFVRAWGSDEEGWQSQCDKANKTSFRPVTKEGNNIVIARHFYIFNIDNDDITTAIFPFTGTMLPRAKAWSSKIVYAPKIKTSQGLIAPPYYYYVYKVTIDRIQRGTYTWYLPNINLHMKEGKPVTIVDYGKEVWEAAVNFEASFKAGEIKAAQDSEEGF